MRKGLDVRHLLIDEVHDFVEGLEHIQAFEVLALRDLRVERGVERVEEPRRRKLMERVVEALGDAGRAGRVVRVSDQEARGPRAPRERRRGGALLPRDDGGAERGDARPRREEREQRLVQARCVELQGDAHDGRRLGRHAWAGCLLD